MEYARRNRVRRAVRAIDHDLHALEIEIAREGRFAEFYVARPRIVAPAHLAELRRRVAAHRLVHFGLDRRLDLVRKLEAVAGEELDAVVLIGIVRGADDDAGRKA